MAAPTPLIPTTIDDDFVSAISTLAARAAGFSIHDLKAPEEAGPSIPKAVPVGFVPGQSRPIDLAPFFDAWRDHPRHKIGTAKALTLNSFADLVKRHKTPHTAIFADSGWEHPAFTAVIDYHRTGEEAGGADWLRHRIRYEFPLSPEWQTWIASNGRPMDQSEFATFLEDRIADLSAPRDKETADYSRDFATTVAAPAALIQLSRGLEVNVGARVKHAVTLQSGESSIQFEETHHDASGAPLKVPGIFMLQISPFFMGTLERIPVRLRYQVQSGSLRWRYQIYRPDQVITEHVREALRKVGEMTEVPTFEAQPEA